LHCTVCILLAILPILFFLTLLIPYFAMRVFIFLLILVCFSLSILANESAEPEAGPQYVEIGPKIIVNLANPQHLMQINPQLLVDGEAGALVKKNLPALKNALIMLYSGRDAEELSDPTQKEALRAETHETIIKTLENYGETKDVKEVFFSDFRIN
jgi:flagellar FliL protein